MGGGVGGYNIEGRGSVLGLGLRVHSVGVSGAGSFIFIAAPQTKQL